MKGPVDLMGAWCTAKCAKYYKKFQRTINSIEKVDAGKVKLFDDWMEDQDMWTRDEDYEDQEGIPWWTVNPNRRYCY